MRLTGIQIAKLFGVFDHQVRFNEENRLTIIVGLNGVGKTAMLKLIDAFFAQRFEEIANIPFESVILTFDAAPEVEIVASGQESFFENEEDDASSLRVTCDGETWHYSRVGVLSHADIAKYLPFLDRMSPDSWFDRREGDVLTYTEIVERFGRSIPPRVRRGNAIAPARPRRHRRNPPEIPDWLNEVTRSVSVRFIETQRLLDLASEEFGAADVVDQDAKDLSIRINRILAEYAGTSQQLDRSFPERVIQQTDVPPSERELRDELSELDARRNLLMGAGVLDQSHGTPRVQETDWEESIRRVLQVYINDTREKLKIFDEIYDKINVFTEIIAEKFQYKKILVNKDHGISIRTIQDQDLLLSSLSSGEQHELVLLYDLLFKTDQNTLLLVDEPELSLHVAWQKRFIPDLLRVMELVDLDVLLATHSPQIINDRWDLATELLGPGDG